MTGIYIYNEASFHGCHWPIPVRVLKKLLQVMLEGCHIHALALHLVRDARIITENHTHLNCQSPTNILSFPSLYEGCEEKREGVQNNFPHILVLSVDTFRRECFLYGQVPLEHAVRLLAHGLGHVLGYDHGEAMWQFCESLEAKGHTFLHQYSL